MYGLQRIGLTWLRLKVTVFRLAKEVLRHLRSDMRIYGYIRMINIEILKFKVAELFMGISMENITIRNNVYKKYSA